MLRRARLSRGLTQAELASRVDLSQPALSSIETGRGPDGPTWNTIARICEALQIEPSFMTTDREPSTDKAASKIRMSRPSRTIGAVVYEALIDDATARVAVSLMSNETRVQFTKALSGRAFRNIARVRQASAGPKLWSIAPHAGMTVKADGSIVLVSPQGGAVEMRAVVNPKRTDHPLFHKGAVLMNDKERVEIRNNSDETSLVFAVHADRLLNERESAG